MAHLPEVIVTGKANSGKSTLLNALMGRAGLVRKSKKAGHTRSLNFFRVGLEPGNLVVVDSPGYGSRGRPEHGELLDEYISSRKELRRIYLLICAEHGVLEVDREMIRHLSELPRCTDAGSGQLLLQPVITKADIVARNASMASVLRRTQSEIGKVASRYGGYGKFILDPIVTAAQMSPPFGIENLRGNVEEACARRQQ